MPLAILPSAAALALACSSALAQEPAAEGATSGDEAPASASSRAAPLAATDVPEATLAPTPPEARGESPWGVLAEAGAPQGLTLSAAYRPAPSVRLFAGPAWNYVGFGIQGGVAIAPWRFAVTPVLTLDAGRYFGADVSFLARNGSGVPPELSPILKDVSYTYGAIHAGIEIGGRRGLSFAADLGLAYVTMGTSGTVTKTDSSGTITFRDPHARATLPSLKLGLHYWF